MGRQQTTPLPSAVLPPADGEALLPKEETLSASNTDDYELMHEEPAKPAITSVPDWLYTERGFFGTSKAATLWWMNVICMLSHIALLTVSVYFSVRDNGSLATPSLTVYLTNLTWIANQTDALIPNYQKTGGISLPVLVITFFGLSALAHGTVAFMNRKQAFATGFLIHEFNPESAKLTTWTGWYFLWMHQCRNPIRCALSRIRTFFMLARLNLVLCHCFLLFAGGSNIRSPQPSWPWCSQSPAASTTSTCS